MKIVLGIITPDRFFASWEFVESLLNLPKDIVIDRVNGCFIEENRNSILNRNRDADVLIMVDADMVFSPVDIQKIIGHILDGKDFVSGIFHSGHDTHEVCLFLGYEELIKRHKRYYDYPKNSVFEIFASGLAFVAMSKNLINKLPLRPFDRITHNNILLGEDLSFCKRLREMGIKLYADSTIKIGHVVSKII